VVAARRRDDSRARNVPEQQVRERAAGFERSRALQLLQLERDGRPCCPWPGSGQRARIDLHDGGAAQIGPDRVIAAADSVPRDQVRAQPGSGGACHVTSHY